MKAVFQLTPAESKRLIAKAVVQMEEVKAANEKGYVIIPGGTTNAYVIQELLELDYKPQRYTAGISAAGVLCVTDEAERHPFATVVRQGKVVGKTMIEALEDFHKETVVIKGANAVDPDGNVGVITSGWDGGTVGNSIGIMTSTGLKYVVPVGLEKLVPSVKESVKYTGAKTYDYSMGANFGMFILTNAIVVTEIQALKILANVEAKHIASGGVGGSEGAVVLVVMSGEKEVEKAISLVEQVKGEPAIPPARRDCRTCPYFCRFQGMLDEELPDWLRR
jgi:hypothetical protein